MSEARRPWRTKWGPWFGSALLLCFIVHALWAKFRLNHVALNLNWDEFNYLSKIYQFQRGELGWALQTFHVHLFAWLPSVEGNEAQQLIAARDGLMLTRLLTCGFVFAIGRALLGTLAGLFAVAASVSFSLLMRHGETFRADPMLACCFTLAAAALILRPGHRGAGMMAGAALGLGALLSIKIALFAPTLALLWLAHFYLGEQPRRRTVEQLVAAAATATLVFGSLLLWHSTGLDDSGADTNRRFLGRAAGLMDAEQLFPHGKTLLSTLRWDLAFWVLCALGVMLCFADAVYLEGRARLRALQLLSFALPLSTIVFYRNSYAYYYVTIIPAAALTTAVVLARLEARAARRPLLLISGLLLLLWPLHHNVLRFSEFNGGDRITLQKRVIDGVHEIFPEPVPYIDRCGMIASFPKVGPLMSSLMLERVRDAGQPIFEQLITRHQPKMVLVNIASLSLHRPYKQTGPKSHRLLQADFATLQKNYIHHWGPVWVAGKFMRQLGGKDRNFQVAIAGPYTVEAETDVWIDGRLRKPGEVLNLEPGSHRARADEAVDLRLRYGEHLTRPDIKGKGQIFEGLGFIESDPKTDTKDKAGAAAR
ncbi:MAG: hypothetical protein OEZ06_22095 [Myxococcales bacterium]|nr:hypothetical protein [Myxococcales bacterium]